MRRRFTLIELLVVIAIIGILFSILLPALSTAKESARRVSCLGKQRHMSTAVLVYAGDADGWLPPYERITGGAMYLGGLTTAAYGNLIEYLAGEESMLSCDGNPRLPRLIDDGGPNERWEGSILYLGGWDCTIGSYFQGPGGDSWTGGDLPYFSPIRTTDPDPGKPVFADQAFRSPHFAVSFANHGPVGYVGIEADVHPVQLDVRGCNVALIDGSAHFKSVLEIDPDPLSFEGYMDWWHSNGGPTNLSNIPGQGWNYTHNARYGQWYF